jgi:hypothetical protein
VIIKEQQGAYLVKLGTMGQEANGDVIYKQTWFYEHLAGITNKVRKNHVVAELYPTHQGRNQVQLLAINGLNAFGLFTDIGTHQLPGDDDLHVVGTLKLAGPNAQTVQAMFQHDPHGSTWQFRLRALIRRQEGRRLVPIVDNVITWDIHHKYN